MTLKDQLTVALREVEREEKTLSLQLTDAFWGAVFGVAGLNISKNPGYLMYPGLLIPPCGFGW